MSERYSKAEAYKCSECGELHDHPALAGKCSRKDELYRLFEEIAELRIRGGICEGEHEHTKLEVSEMIETIQEYRDELEEIFGDGCDHGEYMKHVQTEGGVYCAECDEVVNEHPKDPQTIDFGKALRNNDG